MRRSLIVIISLLAVLAFCTSSFAEIKFKPGMSWRLRHEFWQNSFDMENDAKDNRNFFRIKYSLYGNLEFTPDISFFTKLTSESKAYTYFYQSASRKKGYRYDLHETVFDNLYLDVKNIKGWPLDMRLGRQDFLGTYGEGFLIMDGTPQDGSRTFYFNAAKFSWRQNDKNTWDFIYINNPRDDTFLPIINENNPPQNLNTTNEEAYVLYVKNKSFKNLSLEPYFIHKKEGADRGVRLQAKNGRINTPGIYAKYNMAPFTLRGQFALQSGNYGIHDRQAFGSYLFVDRAFDDKKWSPSASVGYICLSGDNPVTSTNEGWDPLFSRWPWMSELYLLTYNGESGMGYWTNLQMWRTQLVLKPMKKLKLSAWYNYLLANEKPTSASFQVGTDNERGHLPQLRVDYTINDSVSTYFLAEYFIPGGYHGHSPDNALFLRSELSFKF